MNTVCIRVMIFFVSLYNGNMRWLNKYERLRLRTIRIKVGVSLLGGYYFRIVHGIPLGDSIYHEYKG